MRRLRDVGANRRPELNARETIDVLPARKNSWVISGVEHLSAAHQA